MRVSIGIAHASWAPGRKETLQRLLGQLGGAKVHVSVSEDREHARVWARRLWKWASTQDGPTILLNDDVEVSPDLVAAVEAMLQVLPGEIISLHSQLPVARSLAGANQRWLRSYWLSGPGYVLPSGTPKKLLEWMSATPDSILDSWNEDGYANLFSWGMRRPVWHSLPALVAHDVNVSSTLGYDNHKYRSTLVPWTDPLFRGAPLHKTAYWEPSCPPVFVQNPWMSTQDLRTIDAQRDLGSAKYRVLICTPYRGGITPEYMATMLRLLSAVKTGVEFKHELELINVHAHHEDLVRVRSRFVRMALASPCTHLAMVDADNSFDPKVLFAMLRTGKDFVQAPYPRRDGNGYSLRATEKVRAQGGFRDEDIVGDCAEIEGTGMGLTILARSCMERMVAVYGGTGLDFIDIVEGQPHKTVALFQLLHRDGALMSEDVSFATRWRDIGGQVHLYVGDGSPIDHTGLTTHRGNIEDLGLARAV